MVLDNKTCLSIQNIFLIKYNKTYTSPHELVFTGKPNYCQLITIFSTVYFSHTKDNTKVRTNVQVHTLTGISVGQSDTSNGLLVYNPITKELYTTSIYKMDEVNATKTYFNLPYDGGMFSGIYSTDTHLTIPENFPIGTFVIIKTYTTTSDGYVLIVLSIHPQTLTYLHHKVNFWGHYQSPCLRNAKFHILTSY